MSELAGMRLIKVSGIGRDRPGIVWRIAKVIREHAGNIELQHSMQVVGEFAVTVIASFKDSSVDVSRAIKIALTNGVLGKDFLLSARDIDISELSIPLAPIAKYVLSITGDDRMGLIELIALFLSSHKINIDAMESEVSHRPFEGTPVFSATFEISVPEGIDIDGLKTELDQIEITNDLAMAFKRLSNTDIASVKAP